MSISLQPRNKGVHWSDSEVKAFLKIWAEDDIRRDLDESVRNKQVFQRIASKMASRGFNRDWNQCRIKMKNMKREFKLALKQPSSHRGTVLRGRKFFDDLCQLLLGPQSPLPPFPSTSPSASPASPALEIATLGMIKREEPDDPIEEEEEEEDEDDGVMLISPPSPPSPPPFYLTSVLPIITSTCSIRPSNANNTTVSSTTCSATVTSAANATTTTVVSNSSSVTDGRTCSNNNDDDNNNNNDSNGSSNTIGSNNTNASNNREATAVEAEQSQPLPLTFPPDLRSSSSGNLVVHSSTDLVPAPAAEDDTEPGVLHQVAPPGVDSSQALTDALGRLADVLVQMTESHIQMERESRALDRMERRRENRLRRKHEERMRVQEREHQTRMMRLLMAMGVASSTVVPSPM